MWKRVVGFEEYYLVSDNGLVKSLDRKVSCETKNRDVWTQTIRGRILRPSPTERYGHLRVKLYKSKEDKKCCSIHRLVLEAFVGPCPKGMECRHLDGNPQNNHVKNLCWGTDKENCHDRLLHGHDARGSKSVKAKLTEEDIPKIRRLLEKWKDVWGGMSRIARKYKVDTATIRDIRDGFTWRHVK